MAPGACNVLNTTFTNIRPSREKEGQPTVLIHTEDAAPLTIGDGDPVRMGNRRGNKGTHRVETWNRCGLR